MPVNVPNFDEQFRGNVPGRNSMTTTINPNFNRKNVTVNRSLDPNSGYSKKNFRRFDLDLGSAQTETIYEVAGNFILVGDGDSGARVSIKLDDNEPYIPLYPGETLSGIPFERFWLKWDAQTGKEMVLLISTDKPVDRLDTE